MIKLSAKKPEQFAGDMLVYCIRQSKKRKISCNNRILDRVASTAASLKDFSGAEGETLLVYPEKKEKGAKRFLLVGLGKEEITRELFRKTGGTIAGFARKIKAADLMVVLPEDLEFSVSEMAECFTEGLVLGAYGFRKYITDDEPDKKPGQIKSIQISAGETDQAKQGIKKGVVAAETGIIARDMANEPGNVWTPTSFARFGKKLAAHPGLSCTVLGKAEMKRLKMGGILGVNSGSAQPPAMVIVEYRVSTKAPTLLMVGKGLTFDSGGISIKPSNGMEEMKYDMCGGAAVLAAMQAVAREKPKGVNVVAIVPATENLPGEAALKPGDIITIYGGKTVEVVNTDAEGRLILADALAYGIKTFKPDAVVDLATLTGAVVVGLGHHYSGLLSNDDALTEKVIASGERAGEPSWRLPLGPEYRKQIKSEVADIKNVGDRSGGAITAAAFLKEFVGETPWVHLDIAGTAYGFTEKSYIPKGPSGIGARTLVELIRNWESTAIG